MQQIQSSIKKIQRSDCAFCVYANVAEENIGAGRKSVSNSARQSTYVHCATVWVAISACAVHRRVEGPIKAVL